MDISAWLLRYCTTILVEQETGAVMERIRVTRVKDVYETHQFLHQLKGILQDGQDADSSVRLVIIDALPPLFLPFLGESHNDGLGLMNHLVNTIKYLSLEYHVAFLVVNIALWSSNEEALENPREMSAGIRPALGHFWLHVPNTRLLIQKKTPPGDARTVTVTKSTSVALGRSCTVTISGKGVV
ncbi:unnamed protein product [Timema podura]|uniref:Rad51-like C-terminal domain-containing protein n=1 Tax=Timema podura TaxID=61482 RepID=A0ABN7PFJ8_TIMPD|nr:unnamed protein product [Timema podura]